MSVARPLYGSLSRLLVFQSLWDEMKVPRSLTFGRGLHASSGPPRGVSGCESGYADRANEKNKKAETLESRNLDNRSNHRSIRAGKERATRGSSTMAVPDAKQPFDNPDNSQ